MPITEHEKLGVHAQPLSDSLVGVPFKKRQLPFTGSPLMPPQLPSITEHEKLGVHARPLSDSLGVPFKKRQFLFTRSPSLPPQLPPSMDDDCDVQCKPESLDLGSTVSETCGHPVQADAVTGNKSAATGKEVPSDSGEGPKTRDNVSPELDKLLVSSDPGLGPDIEAHSNASHTEQEMVFSNEILPVIGSSQMQVTVEVPKKVGSDGSITVKSDGTLVMDNKMLPVMESTQLQSVMQETLEVAQKVDRDEGKMVHAEEISLREYRSSDTDMREDSSHLCRSSWDLNTTMDAWEGSNTDNSIHGLNQSTVSNDHIKGIDLSLNQSLYRGPSSANVISGSCNLQTNGNDHRLLNQSTVVTEHSNSEACLDLQLKPSSLSNAYPTSVNLNASSEMSFLSLSVKPTTMISSHNPQLATSRVVKSEPYESGSRDTAKADKMHGPNSLVLKHVKSEPCEGHETSTATVSSDLKSVCSIGIKQEPLDQSQGSHRSPEIVSFPINLGGNSLSPQSAGPIQSAGKFDANSPDTTCKSPECKSPEERTFQTDLGGHDSSMQDTKLNQNSLNVDGNASGNTCKSLESDERNLHSITGDPSRHISEDYTMVDKVGDSDIQIPVPSSYLPPDTVMPNAVEDSDIGDSDIQIPAPSSYLPPDTVMPNAVEDSDISRPIISDGNELNSVKGSCKADNLPLLPESLALECKEHAAADVADSVAQVYTSDAYNSSEITQIVERLSAQHENEKVHNNEIEDNIDTSPVALEKNCEYESKVDLSHDAAGGINTLRKGRDTFDEDYEDGEVRDLGLNSAVGGPCKEIQENVEEQVKDTHQPLSPVHLSVLKTSLPEEKEISVHNTSDAKDHDTVVCEVGPCDDKDGQGSSSEVSIRISSKSQRSKTVRKISAIKKHKGPEGNIKSDASHSTNTVIKGDQVGVGNQQEKPEGMLSEVSELCKTESSQADGVPKDVTVTGHHSRIIYLNSTSNKSAFEKMKSKSSRPSSSLIERGIPVDRSFIQERDDSRGSRDEPSKFEVDRSLFHQGGRRVTDFMQNRGSRNDERRISLRGDINTDSDHSPKHINSLTGVQYPRGLSGSEISNDASSNGCSRNMRKQTNHGFQNVPRIPCRGRSPGPRGHVMMVRHPIRDISPRRCIGREVPDFVLAHEENLMRNLPDGMMEPPIPSHPRSQYERSENLLIRRERRSLSPAQRRGGVVHLPVNCTKSSSRAQQFSPHRWTTPERCPDGYYTGPAELVRGRSPEIVRLDRMRPRHQRSCYQDDMVIRRRASPQYTDQVSDDGMNMVPRAREHDFRRRGRGSNRNMRRRFDLLDPREIAEENYFGPPLPHSQIRDFAEDRYGDDRCEERRGPMRSVRQRCVSDDDGEDFRFHVESGPSRPFRLCPEDNKGFPEGGSPRDFNGRLRNRLSNRCGRSRCIVPEEDINYRHNEGQVWHDAGYDDIRMKKRRF